LVREVRRCTSPVDLVVSGEHGSEMEWTEGFVTVIYMAVDACPSFFLSIRSTLTLSPLSSKYWQGLLKS
jgi:hypothetical protein